VERNIIHIDMDAFFVSVERARDPSLRGRPVVVGAVEGTRGVVAAASYEARSYGIHSAMPAVRAHKLCPHAVFLPGNMKLYVRVSRAIHELLRTWTPLVEMTSIDEAYLDLTGFDRCYGPVLGTADRILRQIRDTFGLDVSAGLASNKLLAKIASKKAKPSGLLRILTGCEERFMATLRLRDVPGVGESLGARLASMGLVGVADLYQLDRSLLTRVFGRTGEWLYRMARGRGSLRVEAESPPAKSAGHSVTFSEDTVDRRFLEGVLYHLSEKVGARVRRMGMVGRTVNLRLRYSDFKTLTRADSTSPDTNSDQEIFERALELMLPLLERRVRVRLLGVTLSGLRPEDDQLDLFRPDFSRRIRFYEAVDRVRGKYGFEALRKGRGLGLKNRRQPSKDRARKAG
jgi:DNA polymerase IV